MSDISILGWGFRIPLLLLALASLAGAILLRRHLVLRVVCGVLVLVFGVAFAAAWVNAHFVYYRTLGDLLGRTSADEADVESLSRTDVPPNGQVVTVHIPPGASGFQARDAHVYLPPAWFGRPKPKLPVVMLLHGSPGTPEDWTRGALADQTTDAFAAAHKGVAPVLVMPDPNGGLTADTECVNSVRGKADTYLATDVRDYVIKQFQTATDAKSWAVAGFSEGGNCAVTVALRHPDLFNTFADYGGLAGPRTGDNNEIGTTVNDLFGGSQAAFDAHEPEKIMKSKKFAGMGAWFESSIDDPPPLAAAKQLAPIAKAAGMEVCLAEMPSGDHTFVAWTQAYKDSLPWLAARVGLVPMSPQYTAICKPV